MMESPVRYNREFEYLVQAISILVGNEGRYKESYAGQWLDRWLDKYIDSDELARRLVKRLQLILEVRD